MGRFDSLLKFRSKNKTAQDKLAALTEISKKQEISSFAEVFRTAHLSEGEKDNISNILKEFQSFDDYDTDKDLKDLLGKKVIIQVGRGRSTEYRVHD